MSIHTWARDDEPCRALLRVPLLDELPRSERRPLRADPVHTETRYLVVGSGGTPEEAAAHLAHARFDQQRTWYREGSAPIVVPDQEYLELVDGRLDAQTGQLGEPRAIGEVVLYGNADTNLAWARVLGEEPPLEVRRCYARLGDEERHGEAHFGRMALAQAESGGRWRSLVLLWDTGAAGAREAAALEP